MFSNFIATGILFLFTLAFGVWLSRSGKPYNGILFNIHKLVALATVVVAAIQLFGALKGPASSVVVIVLLVLAGLSVIALFASGALMSAGKLDYAAMLTIHRIASPVLAFATALVIYLLGKRL
jgi:hypothetical protein